MSPDADDLDGLEIPIADLPAWPDAEWDLLLRKPLAKKDGATITSIMLREPTGAEWEEIMAHPVATRRRYSISIIGGVPMGDLARVGIGDLVRGEAYLTSFFDVGQAIGAR